MSGQISKNTLQKIGKSHIWRPVTLHSLSEISWTKEKGRGFGCGSLHPETYAHNEPTKQNNHWDGISPFFGTTKWWNHDPSDFQKSDAQLPNTRTRLVLVQFGWHLEMVMFHGISPTISDFGVLHFDTATCAMGNVSNVSCSFTSLDAWILMHREIGLLGKSYFCIRVSIVVARHGNYPTIVTPIIWWVCCFWPL